MRELPLPDIPGDVPAEGLTIGQAAAVLGLPAETIRYYDRAGLMLDPTPRNSAGQRRYQQPDLDWIGGLVMLRDTGMSIADIRVVAAISRRPGTEAERLAVFESHRRRVLDDLARIQRHLDAIDRKIDTYRAVVQERNPTHADQTAR